MNYSVENESYLMSKMTWDKLSAGDKKIIAEATAKVAAESIQTAKKDDQKYMDLMKKRGIVVHTYTDKELQPQMKAVSKTWDKLSKTMTKELMDGFFEVQDAIVAKQMTPEEGAALMQQRAEEWQAAQ